MKKNGRQTGREAEGDGMENLCVYKNETYAFALNETLVFTCRLVAAADGLCQQHCYDLQQAVAGQRIYDRPLSSVFGETATKGGAR